MKKLFLFAALLAATLCATAQQNQVIWHNGKVMYASPIPTVDSITFRDSAEVMDTLYMLLPRTIMRVDTVYIHDTIYKCPDEAADPDAPLAGVFSIAADKQVKFSKGNLQCTIQGTDTTWAFAENQYDMIGEANVENYALADKVDLFGWSGSTGIAKWGVSVSEDYEDYSGDFVDWGQNIGDGTMWRTLTNDEWTYLLSTRTNATSLMGIARIQISEEQYANGLIFLPDTWTCPEDVTFKSGFASEYSIEAYADYQTFTLGQWQKLEAAGAVFLPASGYRDGSSIDDVQYDGYYWSATATPNDFGTAYLLGFYSEDVVWYLGYRYNGYAVRLVQDL
ncbi:MAG: hypothetical protein ACI3Z8_02680 [Paludibacteraceae bacterium]